MFSARGLLRFLDLWVHGVWKNSGYYFFKYFFLFSLLCFLRLQLLILLSTWYCLINHRYYVLIFSCSFFSFLFLFLLLKVHWYCLKYYIIYLNLIHVFKKLGPFTFFLFGSFLYFSFLFACLCFPLPFWVHGTYL
jgi:hypothetical protein